MSAIEPTASDYFGAMVDRHDSLIRRAVPRYDEMIDRLVEHLPPDAPRILELGCGTGNLTLRLAERFPRAAITFVDAAPEMISITAERAAQRGIATNLRPLTARFEDLGFSTGSFDLIVSCMSLHHVVDKAALYRSARAWLGAGGGLCFADELLGATEHAQKIFWDRWLEFCRRPGHCSEDEVRSLVDHAAAHDHYVALSEHFELLRAAGFKTVDCVWRNLMYSVVVAA
jgi:tRNA (cmo5U34)-methyltransferase